MTHPAAASPDPQPQTSRTGGGRSARLIAAAVAMALIVVVYLGVSGQKAVPAPRATPEPAASAPVALVAPTPQPTPDLNEVTSIRADPTAPLLYQYLGTGLTINGRGTLAVLDQVEPLHFQGMYRIPYRLLVTSAQLDLDAVTASVSHDDLDRLGTWTFPVVATRGYAAPLTALSADSAPSGKALANPEFEALATNGFRIVVSVVGQPDAALMTIDVTTLPDQIVATAPQQIDQGDSSATPTGLGLSLDVGGRVATATLNASGVRDYHAAYRIPLPLSATDATMQLLDESNSPKSNSYGNWTFPLTVFDANTAVAGGVLVDQIRAPEPSSELAHATAVFRNGYRIQITGGRDSGGGILNVDVTVGQDPVWPDETYLVTAAIGNDEFTSPAQLVDVGLVRGEIQIPASIKSDRATVNLYASSPNGSNQSPINTYDMTLPKPSEYPNGTRNIDDVVKGVPRDSRGGIAETGYELKLIGAFDGATRVVFYELRINPTYDPVLFPPSATR